MIIDMDKKPWSCLEIKTIKQQLVEKKWELETRLAVVEILYDTALTNISKKQSSKRFDYLMHKLKTTNRRIILLEGEETK